MARLTDRSFSNNAESLYNVLLAATEIDGSGGVLYGKNPELQEKNLGITPNDEDFIILIGIGGTGIRTLDYIKRKVMDRLHFSWSDRIAFLGIDADWNEIKHAVCLKPEECINLKDENLENRVRNAHLWPDTWSRIADEEIIRSFANENLQDPGSCGKRLLGKLKVHNKRDADDTGFDEQIVNRLVALRNKGSKSDLGPNGKYRVYVIGSGSGGTCSGAFLEMPALIRKAMQETNMRSASNLSICGMLYLPDTLEKKPEINDERRMKAVGFATLKELDYYTGISMRRGYGESFTFNGTPNDDYHIYVEDGFYDITFLVGTRNGPAPSSCRDAMETIAEYLISMLGRYNVKAGETFLAESAISNMGQHAVDREKHSDANNEQHIPMGERHNVPKSYSAVGFAESSAPVKLVRAFTVGKACEKAGIKALKDKKWKAVQVKSGGIKPFRGADCFMDANEGTAKARELIEPLQAVMKNVIYNGACNLTDLRSCGGSRSSLPCDWQAVKVRKIYLKDGFTAEMDAVETSQTNEAAMKTMQQELSRAYMAFEDRVRAFVKAEGPLAFVNLYQGSFTPVDEYFGTGIKTMLSNLASGKNFDGTAIADIETPKEASDKLVKKINAIEGVSENLIAKGVRFVFGDKTDSLARDWKTCQENVVKAKINKKRGERAIGPDQYIHQYFEIPAMLLTEDLKVFGTLLNILSDIYTDHGSPMNNLEDFSKSCDNACEVNLAALDQNAYEWLKEQSENQLLTVKAEEMRNILVDSFFEDKEGWLGIPDQYLDVGINGQITLMKQDRAIPARKKFDECMVKTIPFTFDLSIQKLFTHAANTTEQCKALAKKLVRDLKAKSLPLFNGNYKKNLVYRSVMYPATLSVDDGQVDVVKALQDAVADEFGGGVNFFASNDTDSIRMYQMVSSLEMYRLNDLSKWEAEYEQYVGKVRSFHMHGYSPSRVRAVNKAGNLTFRDVRPWVDYPSPVAYVEDPRVRRNPLTGEISREGKRQLAIDGVVEEARNLGILYTQQIGNSWVVKMVDPPLEWKVDVNAMFYDDRGFYPEGKALMAEIAARNIMLMEKKQLTREDALEYISKRVYLERTDLPNSPAANENLAWEYALHTLYTHIPMLDRLEKIIPWFKGETEKVREWNQKIQKLYMPSMFPVMLMFGKIRDDGDRVFAKMNGQMTQVVNMGSLVLDYIDEKYKAMLNNKMHYAYVYMQLVNSQLISEDDYCLLFEEAKKEYKALFARVNMGDADAEHELKDSYSLVQGLFEEIQRAHEVYKAKFPQTTRITDPVTANREFREMLESMGMNEKDIKIIFDFYRQAISWKNMIS